MATLSVKNVPDALVRRLKERALAHRRPLNLEVIACLEAATHAIPVNAEAMLARVRAIRKRPVGLRLTDRLLTNLKSRRRR